MPSAGPYCPRCGKPHDDGNHVDCYRALRLEPERYCARCARRMIVQVTPTGWTARCAVHGGHAVGRKRMAPEA